MSIALPQIYSFAYLRVQEFVDDAAVKTLRENIATLSKSSGLIIDIRLNGGGRDENMSAVLAILESRPFPGLNWRSRDYVAAVRSWHQTPSWKRDTYGRQQFDAATHYIGPVVVLTSGTTYSSAEQFVIRPTRDATQLQRRTGTGYLIILTPRIAALISALQSDRDPSHQKDIIDVSSPNYPSSAQSRYRSLRMGLKPI